MLRTMASPMALVAVCCVVGLAKAGSRHPLTTIDGLRPHLVKLDARAYHGRTAVHMVNETIVNGETYAIVPGTEMTDGTIELDVAGQPAGGASAGARGFIGVVFRAKADLSQFECFYLRPTNGRADDQLRRNHSTQYISFPGFPWEKLRAESPGVYESYVDLVTGEWTHITVDVAGQSAKLFVNRTAQPVLIVNDLKLKAAGGLVGLWQGSETDGYFSQLTVTPR
jgi:hypothetical protein